MRGTSRSCGAILVVDDDSHFRGSLIHLLETRGYEATEAATGEEALDLAQDLIPALVVLDICLPGISGYQVCHELRQRFGRGLPILFVSSARTESCDRTAALLVGGDEYMAKPISPDEFVIRVGRMIERSTPLDPDVTGRLTGREEEVLRLLAEGLAAREIAASLLITEKTVRTHIDHIFGKLGVHNQAQAVALAWRRSLLPASPASASSRP